MSFETTPSDLFFSRGDKLDPRLGDLALRTMPADLQAHDVVIVGYPDDAGIKLNGGRPGASQAPNVIRKHFYKMTPPLFQERLPRLIDGGNLKVSNQISHNHDAALNHALEVLKSNARLLSWGGGHDYGYPDMAAFTEACLKKNKRPFIINFDAHLDVRPTEKGYHSGTPFYRLLEKYKDRIDFFEVGIQSWCNSKAHLEWAQSHGAKVISLESCLRAGVSWQELLQKTVFTHFKKDHVLGLSIDIDGFASGHAPGASQVFPMGLDANDFIQAWPLIATYHPQIMGIYEVSPPFDHDDRTARLAAILSHCFISAV